jgi:hypothetical protein
MTRKLHAAAVWSAGHGRHASDARDLDTFPADRRAGVRSPAAAVTAPVRATASRAGPGFNPIPQRRFPANHALPARWQELVMHKLSAEFQETLILVLFGCGAAVLGGEFAGQPGIAVAFGLAIVAGACSLGRFSGLRVLPDRHPGAGRAGFMNVMSWG